MRTKRRITACAIMLLAAASCFAQTTIQFTAIRPLPSNEVRLTWSSDTHRWYLVESTPDLLRAYDDFEAALPNLSANPAINAHTALLENCGRRFYRITGSPPVGPYVNIYSDGGTAGDDLQIQLGTTNTDMFIQFGQNGNDIQYASGNASNDWIEQHGAAGTNSQQALGGTGNDYIYQVGGESNDNIYANAGDGADWIIQQGGGGDDLLDVFGASGDDHVWQNGGDGDDDIQVSASDEDDKLVVLGGNGLDTMRVTGGLGDDTASVIGGNGDDQITYITSTGTDLALIDGGPDDDALTVEEEVESVTVKLQDGTVLYANGPPDTIITVVGVEQIYVVATNGMTNWSWSAP